jgi:hypothetical protein
MGLESKCNELVRRLAEEGVDIATMKILELDAVDTSELVNSIECMEDGSPRNGARFVIFTTCDHAIYVEFGVGVKGSKSPHPDTSIVGWKYDVNEHGEEGWYYYKNGKWNWTKGMASRPFMYETGQELRKKINDVAQEVFGDD